MPRGVREALVSWDYRSDLKLPNPLLANQSLFSRTFELNGVDSFLLDHQVEGRVIMPVSPLIRETPIFYKPLWTCMYTLQSFILQYTLYSMFW